MKRKLDLDSLLAHNRARNAKSRPRTKLRGPDGRELSARRPRKSSVVPVRTRLLRYAALLALVGLGLGLASLRVRTIQVDDLVLADRDHARSVLSPVLEARLLGIDTSGLARRLESDPWIVKAEVARRIDGRLVVDVDEARPVMQMELEGGGVGAIDRAGRMLPPKDGLDLSHLPLLTDLRVLNGELAAEDAALLRHLLQATTSSSWPLDVPLARVRLRGVKGLELLTTDGVRVVVGEGSLERRLRGLSAALERWNPGEGDTLDLRFERQVVHVPSTLAALAGER